MQSKRAKEIIDTNSFIQVVGKQETRMLSEDMIASYKAKEAVEIAEQEMKDKAIDTYKELCPYHYRGGKCSFNNYEDCDYAKCRNIELFSNELNK